MPLATALRSIMLDAGADWQTRGTAARLLAIDDASGAVNSLLDLFFAQTEKDELWITALTIEHAGDRAAVGRLVDGLYDSNPHRRHAAARALGWIPRAGKRAAKALIAALLDKSQPQPVREEVAESLAYCNYPQAIPPLISVLTEPDVRIRFWAVFALGRLGQHQTYAPGGGGEWTEKVIEALERLLSDEEVPPDNSWAVGKEALAMLGLMEPRYRSRLADETQRVLHDPDSSPEDLRWAEGYDLRWDGDID
jgi:HEAT repeat protein